MKTDIILAGVGGQGILTIATVLGRAALKQNLYIKQAEVHGMSQRGGDVQSHLRISSEPIESDLIPLGRADLILSLEPMEALRYLSWLSPWGHIVTNTTPVVNITNYPDVSAVMAGLDATGRCLAFDIDAFARDNGAPRAANMVLLGAAMPLIDIDPRLVSQAITDVFAAKSQAVALANADVFDKAVSFASSHFTA